MNAENIVTVTHTDTGSHGEHWLAFFDSPLYLEQLKMAHLKSLPYAQEQTLDGNVMMLTGSAVRTVLGKDDDFFTLFPYVRSSRYELFSVHEIVEWLDVSKHGSNLEAVIKVSHPSGSDISFFATDYALNKNIYKSKKSLSIDMVGLAYIVEAFEGKLGYNPLGLTFAADFCGYLTAGLDGIKFIGCVKNSRECVFLDAIPGLALTVSVTPAFDLEIFAAKHHIKTEIALGKQICGFAWVQGTLEKEE